MYFQLILSATESGDRHYSSVKSKYFAALNIGEWRPLQLMIRCEVAELGIAPDSHARRTSDPPKPTRSDSIDIQQQSCKTVGKLAPFSSVLTFCSAVPPPMFRMDESQDSLLRR